MGNPSSVVIRKYDNKSGSPGVLGWCLAKSGHVIHGGHLLGGFQIGDDSEKPRLQGLEPMAFLTYIYFNEPEIDRLYSQHAQWAIIERSETKRQELKGGVSASIFGAGFDAGGNKESQSVETSEPSSHYKLQEVKGALASAGELSVQLQEAAKACPASGRHIFVDAVVHFKAPQFWRRAGNADEINRDGSVLLEGALGDDAIDMSMGLHHMPRVKNGHMSYTGHDAILLRQAGDDAFPFRVFGFLYRVRYNHLNIRPVTVAL
jgi:hypothetical protein